MGSREPPSLVGRAQRAQRAQRAKRARTQAFGEAAGAVVVARSRASHLRNVEPNSGISAMAIENP